MSPSYELKCEHRTMAIILNALKKTASDLRRNRNIDFQRFSQITEFLMTYNDGCHHEKEEQFLFPALLEHGKSLTAGTIHQLTLQHRTFRDYLKEIDHRINESSQGRGITHDSLSAFILEYIAMQEKHIEIENSVLLPISDKILSLKQQETITLNFKFVQGQNVGHIKLEKFYILLTNLYTESLPVEPSGSYSY